MQGGELPDGEIMEGDWKFGRNDERYAHFYPTGHWWSLCTMRKLHLGIIVHDDAINIDYCPNCRKLLKKED